MLPEIMWRVGRLMLVLVILVGTAWIARPLGGSAGSAQAMIAAADNDNHDDPTDDNTEERILRGQVLEILTDRDPPEMFVATTDENVRVRVYGDQLQRSGVRAGDHVRLQGEYIGGVFDAYNIDVTDRCCPPPDNDDRNNNDNN